MVNSKKISKPVVIVIIATLSLSLLLLIYSSNRNGNLSSLVTALSQINDSKSNKISDTLYEQQPSTLSIIKSMRGEVIQENSTTMILSKSSPITTSATTTPSDKNNTHYYIFSKNRNELTTPQNNSHVGEFGDGINIALIVPTFTQVAYNNSFYLFFQKYAHIPNKVNVTTDLNLLSGEVTTGIESPPSRSAFAMLRLLDNLNWITQKSNITVLTDADVDNGSIFAKEPNVSASSNYSAYDVIVLGHQEYVTQKEYDNLRKFVANGGTMIILDGNVFYAEVKYNRNNHTITLVKGHSWAFNGKSAWKSIDERWRNETSQWVGSNYLCLRCIKGFGNNPFGYLSHEEQYMTNPQDIILLNYNASVSNLKFKPVIATYQLNYQKGRVIALGIYSEDIISNGKFHRYLNSLLLRNDIQD